MPLSVVYINVDGQPMSEIRGGVVTEYVHDPLGNLIATNTSVGIVTWTGDYWPYGESMISSGSKANSWGFGAAWGYYDDGYDNSCVRRRVLRRKLARWQTVDPLWPDERPFEYAGGSPVDIVDFTGTKPPKPKMCKEGGSGKPVTACGKMCIAFWEGDPTSSQDAECHGCCGEMHKKGGNAYRDCVIACTGKQLPCICAKQRSRRDKQC